MILIGLTGPIGHGKTTFAELLTSLKPGAESIETSAVISEVVNFWLDSFPKRLASQADSLELINQWIEQLEALLTNNYGLKIQTKLEVNTEDLNSKTAEKLHEYLNNLKGRHPERITLENKEQNRPLLQWLGSYLVTKVTPTVWFDILVSQAESVRGTCPLFVISGLRYPTDGDVVKSHSGVVVEIVRPDVDERDLDDPTEELRTQVEKDTKVINRGSIEDLKQIAKQLLADIEEGQIKAEYKP